MERRLALMNVTLSMLITTTAHSATCTWLGITSEWCDPRNWSCGCVPGPSDDVVIPMELPAISSEPLVNCDSTINSLTICSGRVVGFFGPHTLTIDDGPLHIRAGGVLDIDAASSAVVVQGADALDVDGATAGSAGKIRIGSLNDAATLRLAGASSVGHAVDGDILLINASAVLAITDDVEIGGYGNIVGNNATQQISISTGVTFTNSLAAGIGGIRGALKVVGSGSFENKGRVEANGGVLELGSGLAAVSDCAGSNRWIVASASGSQLRFSRAATSLQGNFVVANALELGVTADVWTCGMLTYNDGATIHVDEDNDKSFRYDAFDGSSTCSNPFDNSAANGCGGTVFEVNSDHGTPCS